MSRRRSRGLRAWVGVAAIALSAAAAKAENTSTPAKQVETSRTEETRPSTVDSRAAGQQSTAAAGVRAFVDPETGRLIANPTREQLQQTTVDRRATALSRSTVGLRAFDLSRGGRGLNLAGRFQTAMRVERQPDGSFRVTCGHADGHEDGHTHDDAASAQPQTTATSRASTSTSTASER